MHVPSRDNVAKGQSSSSMGSMTPMIDVVFLLLIFFVWTSSFQVEELLLPSGLAVTPGQSPEVKELDVPIEFEPIVVRLEPISSVAGTPSKVRWRVNDRNVGGLEELSVLMRSLADIQVDLPVVIDAAPEIALHHVVDVYDEARLVGFAKILFAAR